MDNKQKKRRKLTKKGILYLINGIFFAIILLLFFLKCAMETHTAAGIFIVYDAWIWILLIQCAFSILTLIVYFLSIIADAISNKYNDKKE